VFCFTIKLLIINELAKGKANYFGSFYPNFLRNPYPELAFTGWAESPASAYVKNTASALCYLCSLCTYVPRGKRHKGEQPLKQRTRLVALNVG
ncbi:hypothetical protein, partial [Prevotellamassilia timonensis]|uniref:hypothetical protein n=1 Tax=Prevotellamassilia timonensis TaxID=1852370 RepID=UPI00307A8188